MPCESQARLGKSFRFFLMLLREGERQLAFTDDSLISIVERCHRATFISSAADFLCMVQYLQLVFKVSG